MLGVGAVGRVLSEMLVINGVGRLTLFDHDIVDVQNLGVQGYRESDVGDDKVEACSARLTAINSNVVIAENAFRWSSQRQDDGSSAMLEDDSRVCFCCVDSVDARRDLWSFVRKRCDLWVDVRMFAATLRVIAITDPMIDEYYETTLFSAADTERGTCTARSMVHPAYVGAGLAVHAWTCWINGQPFVRDKMFNMNSDEIIIDPEG